MEDEAKPDKRMPLNEKDIFENIAHGDILENFEECVRPKRVRKRSSILKRASQDAAIGEFDRGENRRSLKRKVSFATTFQVLEFQTDPKSSANESAEGGIAPELPTPEELLAPPPIPEKISSSKSITAETANVSSILKESDDSVFESSIKRAKKEVSVTTKSNTVSSAVNSNQSLQETTVENTFRNQFGLHENEIGIISIVPVECFDKSDDEPSVCQLDGSGDIVKPIVPAGLIIEKGIGDAIFNASFLDSDNGTDSSLSDNYTYEKIGTYSGSNKTPQSSNATVHDDVNMSFSILGEKDASIMPNDSFAVPKSGHDLANRTAFFADPMDITCQSTWNKGNRVSSTIHDFDPDSSFAVGKDSTSIQSNKTAFYEKSMDLTCKLPSTSHKSSSEISFTAKEETFLPAKYKSIAFGQANKTAFLEDTMDFTGKLSSTKNNADPLKDYSLMSNTSFMIEESSPAASTKSGQLKSNKTAIFDESMDFTCKLPSNKVSSKSHHPVLDSSYATESGVDQARNNKTLLFNDSVDFTCKLPSIGSHSTALSQADHSLDADKSHNLSSNASHTPVMLEESINERKSMSILCPNTSKFQKQFERCSEPDHLSSPLASCEKNIPKSSDINSSNDSIRGTNLVTSECLADKSVAEKETTPLSSKTILCDKSLKETRMVTAHVLSELSHNCSIRLSQFDDAATFRLENMDLITANSSRWQENSKCLDNSTSECNSKSSEDTPIKLSLSEILNETDHYIPTTPLRSLSPDENEAPYSKFFDFMDSKFRFESPSHSNDDAVGSRVKDKDDLTVVTNSLNDSKNSKRKLSAASSDYHSPPKSLHISPEWDMQLLNESSIQQSRNCPSTILDLPEKVCDNKTLFQQDMDFTCLNRKCVPDSSESNSSFKNELNESWSRKQSMFKTFSQSPSDVFDDNVQVPLYSVNGSPLCTKVDLINEATAGSPFENKRLLSDEKTRRFSSQGMDLTCIESERNTGVIKLHFPTMSEDGLQIEKIVKDVDSTFKVSIVGMDLTCNVSTRLELEANLTQLKPTVRESDIPLSSACHEFDNLKDTSEISSSDSFQDVASAITTCKGPTEELEKIQQSPPTTKEKLVLPTSDVTDLQELAPGLDIQSPACKDRVQDYHIATCQTSHSPVQSAEIEILSHPVFPSSHKVHITEHGSSPDESSMSPSDPENLNKTSLTLNSCSNTPCFKTNFSYCSDQMNNSRKFYSNESRVSVPYVDGTDIPEILKNNREISAVELDDVFDISRDETNFEKVVSHENCADALKNRNEAYSSEIDPNPNNLKYVKNSVLETKFLKQDDLQFKVTDCFSVKDCDKKPTAAPAFPEFSSLVKRTKMINLKEILNEKRKLRQLPNDQLQVTLEPSTCKDMPKPLSITSNLESTSTTSSSEPTGTTVFIKTKPVDAFIPPQPPPDKAASHAAEPVKSRTASQFDVLFKIRSLKRKNGAPYARNKCPDNNSSINAFNPDKTPLMNLSTLKEAIHTTDLELSQINIIHSKNEPFSNSVKVLEAEPKLPMERQSTLEHPSNRSEHVPDNTMSSFNNRTSVKNLHSSLNVSHREACTDYFKSSFIRSAKVDAIDDSYQLLSDSCLKNATFDAISFYTDKPLKQSQTFEDSKLLDGFPMLPVAHSTICEGQNIFEPTVIEDEDDDVPNEAEVLEKPIVREARKTYVIAANVQNNLQAQLENKILDKSVAVDDVDPIEVEESSCDDVFLESSNKEECTKNSKTDAFLGEDKPLDIAGCQIETLKDVSLQQKSSEIDEKMDSTHYQDNEQGTLKDITLQNDCLQRSYVGTSPSNENIPVSTLCGNETLKETNYIVTLPEKSGDKDAVKNQTLKQDAQIKQLEDNCLLDTPVSNLHLSKLEKSALARTRLIQYSLSSTESMNDLSSSIQADQSTANDKDILYMEQEGKSLSTEGNFDAKSSVITHENESLLPDDQKLNESSYIIMLSCVDPKKTVCENNDQDTSDHEQNKSVQNVLQEELSLLKQNFDEEKLNADLSTVESEVVKEKNVAELAEENYPLDHETVHTESNKEASIKFQGTTLEKYSENDLQEDKIASLVTNDTSKEKSGTAAFLNVERNNIEDVIEGSSMLNTSQVENMDTNADGDKVFLKHDAVIEQLEDDCFVNKEKSLSSVQLSKRGKDVLNSSRLVDYSCSTSSESSISESNPARQPYQPKIYADAKLWKMNTLKSTRLVDYSSTSSEGSANGSASVVQPFKRKVHADIESLDNEQERHEHAHVCKGKADTEGTPQVVDEQVKSNTVSEGPKKLLISEEKSIPKKSISKESSNEFKNGEIDKDPNVQPKEMEIDEIANKELLVKDAQLGKIVNVRQIETSIVTVESNEIANKELLVKDAQLDKILNVHQIETSIVTVESNEITNKELLVKDAQLDKIVNVHQIETSIVTVESNEIANKELLVKDAQLDKIVNAHQIETSIVTVESNLECIEDVDDDHMECDELQKNGDNLNLRKLTSMPDVLNGLTVAVHNEQQQNAKVTEIPSASDKVDDNLQSAPETTDPTKTFQKDKASFMEDEPMVAEGVANAVELQISVEEPGMDVEEAPVSPVRTFKRLVSFDDVLAEVYNLAETKKLLWTVIKADDDQVVFSFPWHCFLIDLDTLWDLRMTVKFGDDVRPESGDSTVVRELHSISFESVFNETVEPVIKLTPKIFHQLLGSDNLVESYPDTSRFLELLSRCSKAVRIAQDFIDDVGLILIRHRITIEEDRMLIPIASITLMSRFVMKIPVTNIHLYPYEKLTPVAVKRTYGRPINEKVLGDVADEVIPKYPYLHTMMLALERMQPPKPLDPLYPI